MKWPGDTKFAKEKSHYFHYLSLLYQAEDNIKSPLNSSDSVKIQYLSEMNMYNLQELHTLFIQCVPKKSYKKRNLLSPWEAY
jgi:hypothetical protein